MIKLRDLISERVTLGASKAMRIGKKLGWDVKKRASGRTDYVTFTKDGKKYGPVDASILTQDFLIRKLKEKLEEKFASKAQQRFMFATDKKAAKKLASKMTKKDYDELPDRVKEGDCDCGCNENAVFDHDGKAAPYGSGYKKVKENFKDGKVKGKSRPGRVKRSGASCKGSVTDLRAKAKKYGGEKGKMYHWCANMKSGRK